MRSNTTGTTSGTEAVYAARRERVRALMAALDLDVPNTAQLMDNDYRHKPMRWVVETESARGFGRFLTGAGSREDAERVGGSNVDEGWWPIGLYDLDALAGDKPETDEGDTIRVGDGEFVVSSTDTKDGLLTLNFWEGEHPRWTYAGGAEVVERAYPDKRLPVRYSIARVAVVVAFNSTPEG